jgi:integrase
LIERGENVKYIQSQLGHSNPTVTLNIYAHLMNPTNPESAQGLEEMVLETGSKMVAVNEKGVNRVG